MKTTNNTHANALDLHDRFLGLMSELDPVLLGQSSDIEGDGFEAEEVIAAFDAAIDRLWAYLKYPGQRCDMPVPPVPPGLDRLEGDPTFPMDRFKRLLARFVYGAFPDDQLDEFHDSIAVSIGDGEGGSSYQPVVYWSNAEIAGGDTLSDDIDPPSADETPHQSNGDGTKPAKTTRKSSGKAKG